MNKTQLLQRILESEKLDAEVKEKLYSEYERIEVLKRALGENFVVNESSFSRIYQHVQKGDTFAIISPYRAGNPDNKKNYEELKSTVRGLGYGYVEMRGGYREETGFVTEMSLFIPKIDEKTAINLGVKYDQHSIIYKDNTGMKLIGTNQNSGIGKVLTKFNTEGSKEDILNTTTNAIQDFFSSLLKGRQAGKKFVFQPAMESFVIQELEPNSVFRMYMNQPLRWLCIYERKL